MTKDQLLCLYVTTVMMTYILPQRRFLKQLRFIRIKDIFLYYPCIFLQRSRSGNLLFCKVRTDIFKRTVIHVQLSQLLWLAVSTQQFVDNLVSCLERLNRVRILRGWFVAVPWLQFKQSSRFTRKVELILFVRLIWFCQAVSKLLQPEVRGRFGLPCKSGKPVELQNPLILFFLIETLRSKIFVCILLGKYLGLVGLHFLEENPRFRFIQSACKAATISLEWCWTFLLMIGKGFILCIYTLHLSQIVIYFIIIFISCRPIPHLTPPLGQSQLQLMSNIKRWAKTYYNLSPIFADPLFSKAGNEDLVAINPRLFAAYCIRMNKQHLYSPAKVDELIRKYYQEPSYWIEYTRSLLNITPPVKASLTIEKQEEAQIKERFHQLKNKLFNREINGQQFTQLCSTFEALLIKGEVDELDLYVLDISFSTIEQIVEISSINLEAALEPIGKNSLQLIEKEMKKEVNPNIFQLISLFNRIKDNVHFSPQLSNLYTMLQGTKDMSLILQGQSLCAKRQALGYMLWLLHVNELGEFVYKFVKQNYLFSRYCETSVQITCNLLQFIEISPDIKLSQLIILNEVVYKLQDMQEQRQFFQHVKRNVQIELRLKALKEKIQGMLNQEQKMEEYQWIRQLDKYEIDFQSSLSINVIRKMINKLSEEIHFGIILEEESYGKILQLCVRMNEFELYRKLQSKLKRVTKDRKKNNGLLSTLESFYLKDPLPVQRSNNIQSIYELKRIKSLMQRITREKRQIDSIFPKKEAQLLYLLSDKLSKSHKELYSHQISPILQPLFPTFKL